MLRLDLGMTQADLAEKVGLATTTISGVERDAQGLGQNAPAFANALGTTTDYLLMRSDDPLPPDVTGVDEDAGSNDIMLQTLIGEFERLDTSMRRALTEIAITLRLAQERRQ